MAWFKETIDDILSEFHSLHERLHAHADKKEQEAAEHHNDASAAKAKAHAAEGEGVRARNVAGKIAEFVR